MRALLPTIAFARHSPPRAEGIGATFQPGRVSPIARTIHALLRTEHAKRGSLDVALLVGLGRDPRRSRVASAMTGDREQHLTIEIVDTLGPMPLFAGKVAAIDLDGITAEIVAKGKVNDLDQYVPRNLYQVGCNHAFCDIGCGLNRAAFTAAFTVGAAPSATFIPWGAVPANATAYQNGTLVITTGAGASQRRTIAQATTAGVSLA